MTQNHICYNCSRPGMSVFYELKSVPVHSVLLMPTKEKAHNFPKGDISLGFCPNCGFISNLAFDPRVHEYSSQYEETQGFSSTFNEFHKRLATQLIDRYDLHHKDIIEIGCGKGEFLTLLCEQGDNRGVGFDPAYVSERNPGAAAHRVTFIPDFYSEKYAHYRGDFIVCKMTLEHIHKTADFVSTVRRSISELPDSVVFFQVPEVTRILRELAFWDIYYEHCSYFSPGSLARLFQNCGFQVTELWTDYNDQYLMIAAQPADGTPASPLPLANDLESLAGDVAYFAKNCRHKLQEWERYFQEVSQKGHRVVLWGGSSKAVAFLTTLNIQAEIQYVVDINLYKHKTYIAGTGQEIVAPEFLQEYRPDAVIIMNPIYREEIRQDLNKMGLAPELITV